MGTPSLFKILLAVPVLHAICYGQECDPNGISCINCTDYQECSGGTPNGSIFSCKNGVRCGEKPLLEHCWIKLNCYGLNECSEVGIFPDAMVESNYFVCLPDSGSGFIKYDFTCPEGEFFDNDARMCLASAATSETTLSPSLETTTAVQTPETTTTTPTPVTPTSVPTPSPTLETTTATQTPATTTTISVSTSSPTPETTTTTQTPLTTTTSVSTSSPTPETTTAIPTMVPTSPPSLFNCTAPGIFPNPTNCKMYLRCSTSLKAFYYICPGTSYFNENILKCSLIITPACQQQILQNTTTSAIPMTTASTTTRTPVPTPSSTTTTTAVPTLSPTTTTSAVPTTSTITTTPAPKTTITIASSTQTPTTTTTTQIPSTPFACSAAGTFENPLDCKTYYRCSSSGKTFLYVCPNGSYYNELTKRCGLIITPRCRSKLSE